MENSINLNLSSTIMRSKPIERKRDYSNIHYICKSTHGSEPFWSVSNIAKDAKQCHVETNVLC